MTTTAVAVHAVPEIGHNKAMALAQTETARLLEVVDQLTEQDWPRPTDCPGWDVKALLSHVLGNMQAAARARELVRQFQLAATVARKSGRLMIDEMTARRYESWPRCPAVSWPAACTTLPRRGPGPVPHAADRAGPAVPARPAGPRQGTLRVPDRHRAQP